jgi:penicillin amidase
MRRALGAARRWGRRLLAGAGVLVLLALGAGAALAWLTLPSSHEEVRLFGLRAPVEIALDGHGIPHIEAASEEDAARALGYLHARDRLFQMEMMRRVASGRLAEAIGPAGLPNDRLMRTLGLASLAEADAAALPPRVRALFEAYAAGVNAWIAAHGRYACFECIFLPRLTPWTVADSLLWGRYMAWYLGANYRVELARMALAGEGKLTAEEIEALWPASPLPAVEHAGREGGGGLGRLAAALLARIPAFPAPFTEPSEDSNAFAVDGAHSLTGAPLLAGDPHLGFSFPGLWYLVRIDTPEESFAGASAPGVPLIVLGQNGRIAWSFTSNGADTEDLFEETPVDADHYLGPNGPLPYGRRVERIRVRGGKEEILTVRATRHGPVLSDLIPGESRVLALSAAFLSGGAGAAVGLYDLDHARDVAEAGRAAAEIGAPVQNLMVADRTTIALFVTGRVPVRKSPEGFPPQPGADGRHDWAGWREGAELPHFVGAERGFLVNANEEVPAPPGLRLGTDWPGPWRAERIAARLAEKPRLGPDDLVAIERDTLSLFAAALLPRLRALSPPPGIETAALGLLAGWDGTMAMDRPEPLIFNAWMRALARDVLVAHGVRFGDPAAPFLEFTASLFTPEGAARWCGGDCTPFLLRALEEASGELARALGPDPRRWRWGDLHRAVFAHPLFSRLPLLARLGSFTIAAPGDDATIDRGAMGPEDFTAIHGPSYRGVYDLAEPDESRFIIAPGESGHPLSPHAADLLRLWRDGEMIMLPRQVRPEGGEILLLPG